MSINYDVILSPVITEKATMGSQYNQVTFRVPLTATKPEIKAAVEALFKVDVKAVNTLISKGKTKSLLAKFAKLGWSSALIIDGPEVDIAFARAARNLPGIDVLPSQGANVYDIIRRNILVLTKSAVTDLEARLK